MKPTHKEVDNIVVQQITAAENEIQNGISVLTDDTDVFEFLLYESYLAQNLNFL